MKIDESAESPLVVLTVFREPDGWIVSQDGSPISRGLQRGLAVERARDQARLRLAGGKVVELIVENDRGGLVADFMRPGPVH